MDLAKFDFQQIGKSTAGVVGTAKNIVSIIGYLCLIIAGWFAIELGGLTYSYFIEDSIEIPEISAIASSGPKKNLRAALSEYSIINKRNIFGKVASNKPVAPTTKKPPPKAKPLKIRLVGTNTTSKDSSFAIVENAKGREQDIFKLDEELFGTGATLKEINKESIKVLISGRTETFEIEEGSGGGGSGGSNTQSSGDGSDFSVDEQELTQALENLPRLLSQARAVPFFRNGKSIGMRLFAIRRGSMYEKLGLKNGDIVLSVNDNSLEDPAQALKLFEELKSERSIGVVVERNGSEKNLNYSIE